MVGTASAVSIPHAKYPEHPDVPEGVAWFLQYAFSMPSFSWINSTMV
jgi:hypothetical protein